MIFQASRKPEQQKTFLLFVLSDAEMYAIKDLRMDNLSEVMTALQYLAGLEEPEVVN